MFTLLFLGLAGAAIGGGGALGHHVVTKVLNKNESTTKTVVTTVTESAPEIKKDS
jgi:hypothetical protein